MHAAALLALSFCYVTAPDSPAVDPPTQVADSRLRLQVFVEAPEIVTPIGIAINARSRLFVVESHTHFPPAGYTGPKSDRIKIFEDTDGDGKADKSTIFHEGLRHTMNLEVAADQSLLVATRSEILRLRDTDGDGVAEERTSLVQLETGGDYPHNGLSGFAVDFDGNIYFGFGENLGVEYNLIGAGGKTLRGGGEGGTFTAARWMARSSSGSPPVSGTRSISAWMPSIISLPSTTTPIPGRHAGCCISSKMETTAIASGMAVKGHIRSRPGTANCPGRYRWLRVRGKRRVVLSLTNRTIYRTSTVATCWLLPGAIIGLSVTCRGKWELRSVPR